VCSFVAPVCDEYLPAAQDVHVVLELAPSVPEYVPAAQDTHTVAPGAGLYVPAAHGWHAASLVCVSWSEYLPAAQAWQPSPSAMLYVPAGHGLHTCAPGGSRANPTLHTHFSMPSAPSSFVCDSGIHVRHSSDAVSAVVFEYLPMGHSLQWSVAVVRASGPSEVSLYLPSGHAAHDTTPS
jgi:hypothetical protein